MKRIALIVVMALLSLQVSARSVHYFTYSQATRTVSYLNAQQELMIYCGYDYEIPTYVLVNEVWMERVNSSYYELWIYGWDAYTGDEVYMPLDLECVWLFSGDRIYSAAQYLRFRVDVRIPTLKWYIPPYHAYTHLGHRPGYTRSYHYDIHRHGWMPPAYSYHPGTTPPLPYYYMRHPSSPAPMPTGTWTPGTDRPVINNVVESTRDHNASTGTQVRSSHNTSSGTSSGRTGAGTRSGGGNATDSGNTRSGNATTSRDSRDNGSSSRSSSSTGSRDNSATTSRSTTPSRTTVESRTTSSRSEGSTSNAGSRTTSTSRDKGSSTSTTSRSNNTSTSTSSRDKGSSTSSTSRSNSSSTTSRSANTSTSRNKGSAAPSGRSNSSTSRNASTSRGTR